MKPIAVILLKILPDNPAVIFFSNVQAVTENLQKCKSEQKKTSISLEKRMRDLEKTYSSNAHNYDNAELRGSQLQNQKKMNKFLQNFLQALMKNVCAKENRLFFGYFTKNGVFLCCMVAGISDGVRSNLKMILCYLK